MITKKLDLNISMVKFNGLFDGEFRLHISKIKTLRKRLQKKNKYPLKGLLGISTNIEKYRISEIKRKELLSSLQDMPEIF